MYQIDEEHYSSFRKLLSITCYCLKFVKRKAWDVLSTSHKETISRKHILLGKVFNSLSDAQSVHSVDVKLAMILWVYQGWWSRPKSEGARPVGDQKKKRSLPADNSCSPPIVSLYL